MAAKSSFGDANAGFQAGIINGPVSAAFHLAPERRDTPPTPSIVIPFGRDPDFVHRGTTLDQIKKICVAPDARAALVGLGGVGKSQLAIEYAYHIREQFPETWVFWAHTSNAARFEQSFRDIADRVEIAGRQDAKTNIFKLVHDWMCRTKERWLLVLDNVDDARFLLHVRTEQEDQAANATGAARPLREYLPHCERGSILVTTRSKDAARELVESRNVLNVEPMDEAEAIALFKKKLGAQEDSSDIAELTAALEYMPLAVVQAAAYISQRAPRSSVRKYLDKFRKSDRKKTKLLSHSEPHLRRDREAKNSILITWRISFEYIQRTQPSATDLLSLMSFFDRQSIPETLLQRRNMPDHVQAVQKEEGDNTDFESSDSIARLDVHGEEFENDITMLRSFCFISISPDGTTFEMHALVQLATRKWLTENGKLEHSKKQFVTSLRAVFPTAYYKNWTKCQVLYAHVKAATNHQPEDDTTLADWATVLYRAAWFAKERGNFADAEMLATKAMKARMKVLGQEHIDTLKSVHSLGPIYRAMGRLEDAEKVYLQVLEVQKKKLGANHRHTLASMNNLALTYLDQDRWGDAERLLLHVLECIKTKFGANHPYTLTSMNNLASTYLGQDRWSDAERLLVHVLDRTKTKLGADHLHTLISTGNLASTYSNQGRWNDAERLQVQVLGVLKTKLGADHSNTLVSMSELAHTWKRQGRCADAIVLMKRCVQKSQRVLGLNHLDVQHRSSALERWEAKYIRAEHDKSHTCMSLPTLEFRNLPQLGLPSMSIGGSSKSSNN